MRKYFLSEAGVVTLAHQVTVCWVDRMDAKISAVQIRALFKAIHEDRYPEQVYNELMLAETS
jgi:hypothetical protein